MGRKHRLVTIETSTERVGSLVVALIFVVLPLAYWPVARDPNLAKPILLSAGLILLLGFAAIRLMRGDGVKLRPNVLDACVIALALLTFLSWSYSRYRYATATAMRPAFLYLVLYLLARVLVKSDRARMRVIFCLLAGCIAVCLVGLAERYGLAGWPRNQAISATWFNRTFLAAYLLLITPLALWAAWQARGWLRAAGVGVMAVGLPAMVWTGARIVWVGVVPVVCAAVLVAWPIIGPRGRRRLLLATYAVAVLGVALQIGLSRVSPTRTPLAVVGRAFSTQNIGNEVRLALATAAVRVGLGRPVIGGGAGTFAIYAPVHVPHTFYRAVLHTQSVRANVVIADAHNEFAQVFADLGAVGLLAFLAIPICAARLVRCTVLSKDALAVDKWLSVAVMAAIVGFLAANTVGISARVPGEAAFYYLLLAMVGSLAPRDQSSKAAWEGRPPRWAPILAVLVAALLAVTGWTYMTELRASVHLIRGETLMTSPSDVLGAEAATAHFRAAAELIPNDPAAHYELANALAVSGNHPEALRVYRLVEELSPNYGRVHFNQGTSLYNLRRYPEAEHEMTLAYRLDGLPDSRIRLAYLHKLLCGRR